MDLGQEAEQQPNMSNGGLALSLSGGGFRAALFHLGVIVALRQLGRLGDVKTISCVSGGSIVGAYLVGHWDEFIGDEAEFNRAALQIVNLTRRDVRGRIIRRLPRGRQSSLERELNSDFFKGMLLSQVRKVEAVPRLVLNVTDLKHGTAAAFVDNAFLPDVRKQRTHEGKSSGINVGTYSVAAAVACSAAFPALFPARKVGARDFGQNIKSFEGGASLSDGGIYDNLGIQYFLGLDAKERPSQYIISDAGAPFDYVAGFVGNLFERTLRTTEVQMDILRSSMMRDATASLNVRLLSIADEPTLSAGVRAGSADLLRDLPAPEIVRSLQRIRTDLDAFNEIEIDLLFRHGFVVAFRALTGGLTPSQGVIRVPNPTQLLGMKPDAEPSPEGSPPHGDPKTGADAKSAEAQRIVHQGAVLTRSQTRRAGLFNLKDRTFPLPWFMLAGFVLGVAGLVLLVVPFATQVWRAPLVDGLVTGRPYRLSHVIRYVALEPASAQGPYPSDVRATTRLFYWARMNRRIDEVDALFPETIKPTYERDGTIHGLGVWGAKSTRESPGTDAFSTTFGLKWNGQAGETALLSTGIVYDFQWPGQRRSLDGLEFSDDEDFWAYENFDDYVDLLEIVVESRWSGLLVAQGERNGLPECAVLYRGNKPAQKSACGAGEGVVGGETLRYGGVVVARFENLKPGDEAVVKYRLKWK